MCVDNICIAFRFSFVLLLGFCYLSCENNEATSSETNINIPVNDQLLEENDSIIEKHEIHYTLIPQSEWLKVDTFKGIGHTDILCAINRTDSIHLLRMDSIIVPDRYDLNFNEYLSFPENVRIFKGIHKIIIFSLPFQIFAAYEYGQIVRQGQTNSGKKSTPTPTDLYFCNWKAKRSISTVDKSWILNWNFNVSNYKGIGFHQYGLPGYPASHSCMRLTEEDAFFLYHWADQWILNGNQLAAHGTPVIVYSQYAFDKAKPWLDLPSKPDALKYNEDSIDLMARPYIDTILNRQGRRANLLKVLI
ncbi:MAG: L,D-transpeptidase [Chitinophagales bacterium]|nr:L,D-transpeptidase [Chitinophagales bacterium]